MKFKVLEAFFNGMQFRIEEDYEEVGAYLFIYKNEICVKDYLQNNIKACMELALEEYDVPFDKWVSLQDPFEGG